MVIAADPFAPLQLDQWRLLDKFVKFNVDFLIVGGYAMRCHGRDRQTKDLDLVVSQTECNLKTIHFVVTLLPGAQSVLESKLLRSPESKFTYGDVELFATMRGLDYKTIREAAISVPWSDTNLPIIDRIWLKQSKRLAIEDTERDEQKRQIDLSDLAFLEALGEV